MSQAMDPSSGPIGAPPAAQEHSPHLQHHFNDLAQQKESATLGMWIFLTTEVMLFGAIFTGYTVYRLSYYEPFAEASSHLYVALGAINTVILLTSSLMMALAVHHARQGNSKRIVQFLLLTILFGIIFLGIKLTEYILEYREGLVPLSGWWQPHSTDPHFDHEMKLFFVFYFIMTMLHAIHMTAGMLVLATIAWFAHRKKFSAEYYNPVEIAGLYWHFVDIVWVFLFPALYLVHRGSFFTGGH
jgi:cytochrome c oxidase subunit 3